MENTTLKYSLWIIRCESIEYIFFCAVGVVLLFVGYIKVKVWIWTVTHKITIIHLKLLNLSVLVSSIRIYNSVEIGECNP